MASSEKVFVRILRIIKLTVIWFFILSIATVTIYRFVPPPITPLMFIRLFEQGFDSNRHIKLTKKWVSFDKIAPCMSQAVIASEDQIFAEHWGFDFKAIDKAMKNNEKAAKSNHKKKTVKGASTISQQTAKNVFLWPGRSWVRKGFEVYFTLLIEGIWSKERIMEVYLNEIEMGDGIYGVEAASQTYFHKSARNLTQGQAALIAATLPNPLKWSPAKPSGYIMMRQQWIIRNMNNLGEIDL
jgi:monofunctional biosynthetic peptidoglycan transglycosylase